MEDELTWVCDVCRERRPDALIAVVKHDFSPDHGFPLGSFKRNVKHCTDKPECVLKAHFRADWRI